MIAQRVHTMVAKCHAVDANCSRIAMETVHNLGGEQSR
jgi:hypothetical protein